MIACEVPSTFNVKDAEPAVTSRFVKPVPVKAVAAVAAEPAPDTSSVVNEPAVSVPAVPALAVPSRLFAVAPVMAAELKDDLVE